MQKVVDCANCGIKLGLPEGLTGPLIQCPSCFTVFSNPSPPPNPKEIFQIKLEPPSKPKQVKEKIPARGVKIEEEEAQAPSSSNGLIWALILVMVLAGTGGGVFLALKLTGNSTTQPIQIAQEQTKPIPEIEVKVLVEDIKPAPVDPPVVKEEPVQKPIPFESKKEAEPAKELAVKEVPKKELPVKDLPKIELPKMEEPKKEEPKEIIRPKDEILIAGGGWFGVNSLLGRFQVDLPAAPVFQPLQEEGTDLCGPAYMAKPADVDLIFRAGAMQLTGKAALDPASDHQKYLIERHFAQPNYQMRTERDINYNGHKGREFLAEGSNKIKVAGRYFRLEEDNDSVRIFYFTVAGPRAGLDLPEIRKFFASVKLEKGDIFMAKMENRPNTPEDNNDAMVGTKNETTKTPGNKNLEIPFPDLKKSEPTEINPPFGIISGEVGKIAGKLPAHLGVVVDAEAKGALLILPGGQAKLLGYPDFKPLGNYKLAAGTAYRSIYEPAKGRLFALTPNFKLNDPTGKAGGSQLVVYSIRPMLQGKVNSPSELLPTKTIPLGGFCSHLCLAPDGLSLFALEIGHPKAIKVVRVNLDKGEIDGNVAMPEFTDGLVLARDGKSLYAQSHLTTRLAKGEPCQGAILIIDPQAMKLKKTIPLTVDPFAMELTKEGIAFVSGYGGVRSEITVVDTREDMPVIAKWIGIPPNSCLKLSDDEKRLFVSNWKGSPALVSALAIPDTLPGSDLPKAQWSPSPPYQSRGEIFITPDNRFLICDSGVVFNLN